jgi:hypothetical protein
MDPIIAAARNSGMDLHREYGMVLVPLRNCTQLVSALEKNGLVILGVEGFRRLARGVVADSQFIADFSSMARLPHDQGAAESAAAARRYLKLAAGHDDLWFDFTVKERGENG